MLSVRRSTQAGASGEGPVDGVFMRRDADVGEEGMLPCRPIMATAAGGRIGDSGMLVCEVRLDMGPGLAQPLPLSLPPPPPPPPPPSPLTKRCPGVDTARALRGERYASEPFGELAATAAAAAARDCRGVPPAIPACRKTHGSDSTSAADARRSGSRHSSHSSSARQPTDRPAHAPLPARSASSGSSSAPPPASVNDVLRERKPWPPAAIPIPTPPTGLPYSEPAA
mmetsp:Transcript_42880/g.128697  ORF Transcript_42880/g.128697 Transcript_42880/m.128697 type:complete len:226 (-) Transcript_42880:1355-2032(-)